MSIQFVRRSLAASLAGFLLLTAAQADTNAIIAKARSYIGPESALESLKSVHYVGKLITIDETAAGGPQPVEATVEIIFQKPFQQRIEASSVKGVETTALDGYDGWQRIQDAKDASRWRVTLLSKEQIKRLRANTWENLAFFRGLERRGGRVEDLGEANVNGVACHKLAFRHDDQIVFFRYFDKASGKLVLTETEGGGSIKEEGEITANGVRFPKKVVTVTRTPDGKERSVTVTFDKVTINETFPNEMFTIPSLAPSR